MRYVPEFAMLLESADWRCYESTMIAKTSGGKDIISRVRVDRRRSQGSMFTHLGAVLCPGIASILQVRAHSFPSHFHIVRFISGNPFTTGAYRFHPFLK